MVEGQVGSNGVFLSGSCLCLETNEIGNDRDGEIKKVTTVKKKC